MIGGRTAICAALTLALSLLAASTAAAVTPVTCAGLQSAVESAGAGAVLQLPPGVCHSNIEITNTAAFTLEGATSGGATVLEPTTVNLAIVQSTASSRFTLHGLTFTGMNGGPAVSLQGAGEAVTISGSTFESNKYTSGFGAAISIQIFAPATATQPTVITGNTFSNNQADGGGAVAVLQSAVPLTISNNRFTNNRAQVLGGGALSIDNADPGSGPVQITGNTFGGPGGAGNTSAATGGAASIQLRRSQRLTLSSNTFQGNRITGAHTATINDLRLGGALYMTTAFSDTPYPVAQSHNSFIDNVVDETQATATPLITAGGAGEWITGLTVSSLADKFIGNRVAVNDGLPPEGGALGVFASAPAAPAPAEPGVFTGSDDLFSGNSTAAKGWGGGLYVGGTPTLCTGTCPPSSLTLDDSTLVGNSVDAGPGSEGGAIWGSAKDKLAISNSIVFGNKPKPELFGFGSSATSTVSYSDACSEPGGLKVPGVVGYNICADPKLDASGKETFGSPTIDRGLNLIIPKGLTTDLAGNPRIQRKIRRCGGPQPPAVVDMGAYEFPTLLPPCPHPPPFSITIAVGKLRLKNGSVKVRLTCVGAKSFCDGTLELGTRHSRVLGKHHFHIRNGHNASVKITLSSKALRKLGSGGSIKVSVKASAHDAGHHHTKAHRTLTLKL